MRRMLVSAIALGSVLALAGSCGKKDKEDKKKADEPKAAEPAAKQPAVPEPLSQEGKLARLVECWGAYQARDAAKLEACYDANATSTMIDAVPPATNTGAKAIIANSQAYWASFPDMKHELGLTLVKGDELITVAANSGVNGGEFMGAPPTQKKVGNFYAQYVKLSPAGQAVVEQLYFDMHQLAAQMGMAGDMPARTPLEPGVFPEHAVVYSEDSDTEKANLELVDAWNQAYNNHDVAKVMEYYADDALMRDNTMAEDIQGKKAIEEGLESWYKMTSDVKGKSLWRWAAGDYVVSAGEATGTWDGPIPGMPKVKPNKKQFTTNGLEIVKIVDGKVKEHWMFGNSASFAVQLGLAPDPTKAPPPAKGAP